MGRYSIGFIAQRLGIFLLTIWIAASVIWLIPRLAPGDPISAMIMRMSSSGGRVENADKIIAGWKERFGLNDPLPVQYVRYMGNLLRFDFGYSLAHFPTPVADIIGLALPWTLGLLLVAVTLAFFIGNFLGAIMVWGRTPGLIRAVIPMFMIFTSIPSILAAIFLIYVFAFLLEWFPLAGSYPLGMKVELSWRFISAVIWHATLPALSVVLVNFGYWTLGMRGMMITVEGEDYIQLARAKGLKPFYVLYRYLVRNAILPQITAFAITLGSLVSGQVLVEYIFGYQGMGNIIFAAITSQDFPVIQGASFMLIVITALAVLIMDLTYPLIDPRISYERN